jgi:Flp pilus assembly protein TadG
MSTATRTTRPGTKEKGFALLATGLSVVAVIGMLALAFDLGRAYLAKNEAQVFTDAASLEATMELDGTMAGIARAESVVAANPNRWNFGNNQFGSVQLSYAKDKAGPWDTTVIDARDYRYARVTTTVDVPLTFFVAPMSQPATFAGAPMGLFLFSGAKAMPVNASSLAGQEPRDAFREGLMPFSPFAHNAVGPHYGLEVGQQYTLRWASNPRLNGNNTCAGDRLQSMIDLAQAGGGDERGYIEENSASVIRDTILYDYQTIERVIGDSVTMTGGAKQTILSALQDRVNQDTNTQSANFTAYVNSGTGNGRRLIGVPINTGNPDYRIVQIGAFFLLRTQDYNQGGNKPFCAEYVGAWLQGGKHKAAADAGSYVARLVR